MDINRWLRLIAGMFVLTTLALGYFVNPWWYLFTAFVGLNLFQSAFTNWCPMMTFLRKLGVRPRIVLNPSSSSYPRRVGDPFEGRQRSRRTPRYRGQCER
jgi:hypothetical protein